MDLQSFFCQICYCEYNDRSRIPHTIPICNHTLCSSCLSVFLISSSNTSFTCPFDSKEFSLDQPGLNNFPKNIILLSLITGKVNNIQEAHALGQGNKKDLHLSSNGSTNASFSSEIDKEESQPASDDLKLVVTNKLGNLERVVTEIEAVEQKIYDRVEEAVENKEKFILRMLDEKFAEYQAILDRKKKEMIDRVTAHFSSVKSKVKHRQNLHESQYEAKTKVIEWKNIVKKKMDTWKTIKTVDMANGIIEEDETAMVPEIKLWMSRIDNVLNVGNLDVIVDKSFMVFDEDFTKTMEPVCEFKVVQEDNMIKESIFGSEERSTSGGEMNKTDSDTSPRDTPDKKKFLNKLFKAYNLNIDSTLGESNRLRVKPKANTLLLPATSNGKKKKKFMFENFDDFETLEINCEDFKDKSLSNLAEVLQFFIMLKELRLAFVSCDKIQDSGLESLGLALKGLPSLQKLTLEFFSACPKVSDQGLGKFVLHITSNPGIQKLYIPFAKLQGVTDKSFTCMWDDFAEMSSLTHLRITIPDHIKISDEGLARLSTGLKQMTTLQELELSIQGNEKLGNKGFSQFSEALSKLSYLTSLRISIRDQSGNINDGSFSSFAQALSKLGMLKSLTLELPKCFVSNEKFIEFSQTLPKLSYLKILSLDFSWSLLSDESLSELSKAVLSLFSLRDLQLDFTACDFSNEGFKALTKTISRLFNLNRLSLDFSWCKDITDEGVIHLVEAISKLSNLSKLEVSFKEVKKITEGSVLKLCGVIPKTQTIEQFDLNVVNCGRDLNEDTKVRMEEALSMGRRYINRRICVVE